MAIFWTEERISKSGDRLPCTEVRVAGLSFCFRGRIGSKLREAVNHLEQQEGVSDGEGPKSARIENS